MKKVKIHMLLLLFITTLFACNNDLIWDIAPVDISFKVCDAAGNDLLNPATEGAILEQDIQVIFNDISYPRDVDMSNTRYYLAVLSGLKTAKIDNQNVLTFGEFSGDENQSKTFTVDWGDGTTDEIKFDHEFEMKRNKPKRHTTIYLNGEKVSGVFTITKPKKVVK